MNRVERPSPDDRGAALVEFAIAIPFLLALIFGMIDFGFVFSDQQALRDGTRSATRSAVVGVVGSDSSCVTAVMSHVPNADTSKLVCAVKSEVGGDPADVRVKINFGSYAEGEKLTICSMAPSSSLTGVLDNILTDGSIKGKVEMRIENTDTTTLISTEESPQLGLDWTWCV